MAAFTVTIITGQGHLVGEGRAGFGLARGKADPASSQLTLGEGRGRGGWMGCPRLRKELCLRHQPCSSAAGM